MPLYTTIEVKGVDPTNFHEAKARAINYFKGRSFVSCKRGSAELAVRLKWNLKWPAVKQRTYYFTSIY